MNYTRIFKILNLYLSTKQKEIILSITHMLSVLLLNLIAYSYVFTKFFRIMCYSKLAFRTFPTINPYVWPYVLFNILTEPYFKIWNRIFPPLRYKAFYIELHTIIGIEFLNFINFGLIFFANILSKVLTTLEANLIF